MSQSFIRNGTVLLVNDDVNARIIEETLLEGQGIPVRAVVDAYAACDLLARDGLGIAVVVMSLEIDATEMSGWQLLLRGHLQPILLSVQPRIVVTTARQDLETVRFFRRLGADAVLHRPVAPRDFIETVERLRQCAPAALVDHSRYAAVKTASGVGTNGSLG
jgi:CheY-like chemotaxis protein